MEKHNKYDRRGFTIVELLVVIVVIGILAAVTIVAYNGISARAKNAGIASSVSNFMKARELMKLENGKYPVEDYVKDNINNGLGGIGSYRHFSTFIVNIDDLRSLVSSKGLAEENIGALSYTYDSIKKEYRASQDSSTGGYFKLNSYEYPDQRVYPYLQAASGIEAKITAYDTYQKEVLGITDIPSVYTSSNVLISTAATGSSRNIPQKRVYPFMSVKSLCHMTSRECFTEVGYYVYGKDTYCPLSNGVATKASNIFYNSYGSGASTNHNMTFCVLSTGSGVPTNFPN